ncbi:hypothetical protein DSECCO2_382270 [anaerobic digester metagenome]
MTRAEHEDAILDLLRAALPQNIKIGSVPRGMEDSKARDVRDGAVWVMYAGGVPAPGEMPASGCHQEFWSWSVICLAKTYRSDQAGAATALGLLEAVIDALDGAEIEGRNVFRVADAQLAIPEEWNLMGYESQFTIEVFTDR